MKDTERIVVLEGGETRNETIMNSIAYIEKEGNLNEDTIIVTHDSVRPFVTQRILEENIRYAKEYGACDTAVAATDTIVCSEDNVVISDIPERRKMYQGQTPQTFKHDIICAAYDHLNHIIETKGIKAAGSITDDAMVVEQEKGTKIRLVEGSYQNIKITTPEDLDVAETFLKKYKKM